MTTKSPGHGFVDADELPGAIRLYAGYYVQCSTVAVAVGLWRIQQTLDDRQLQGVKENISDLAGQLAEAIEDSVARIPPEK